MNPVTLAVVKGGFEQIGDEMDLHLIHAAISPIISETNDCANGIFHPMTGETIAQGRYGLPVFLAYMQLTVQNLIKFVEGKGGFQEGDIWIVNNPYFGGSHLQDAQLVAPYFAGGKLFALMANTGHWMDIGGSVPGGWAPKATEIHQEGIIPPLKLYEAGKLNQAVVDMIRANVRLPDQITGDMMAMANVFAVGRRGLDGLVRRCGSETVAACVDEMVRRSEAQMRSHIAEIPDGTYVCEDRFDNDGVTDEPIAIKLTLTVRGDGMHLDFTGTTRRQQGPFNISYNPTASPVFVAIKHIFPDVPFNGGTFRPITFTVPANSMLRPDLGAKQEKLHLRAGDGVEFRSPGGGGFGDPLTRDAGAVERNLNLRYVSRDTAEQIYGVVISDIVSVAGHACYCIDRNATADRRRGALAETVGGLP